jgi:tRNA threonylcarbamoyl adenosine modification protein YeaZ
MIFVWDTSSRQLSLGLIQDTKFIFSKNEYRETYQQSNLFFSELRGMLSNLNLSTLDIKALAVGIGPGSYTGLRVGITVAKIWGYARQLPCYRFSSAEALQRTQARDPSANFLDVSDLLFPQDFSLIEHLTSLAPIYENDHFA